MQTYVRIARQHASNTTSARINHAPTYALIFYYVYASIHECMNSCRRITAASRRAALPHIAIYGWPALKGQQQAARDSEASDASAAFAFTSMPHEANTFLKIGGASTKANYASSA